MADRSEGALLEFRNPYPGPRPFRTNESGLFFGRRRETLELTSVVLSHRLVLLHAQSGIGKSSLIAAGVAPRLAASGLSVVSLDRLGGGHAGPGATYHGSRGAATEVRSAFAGSRGRANPYARAVTSALRRATAAEVAGVPNGSTARHTGTALVFDQFEEVLAESHLWKERLDFLQMLGAALEAQPLLRIVLALREDYLAEFQRHADAIGRPVGAQTQLLGLDDARAIEAVVKPADRFAEHCRTTYDEGVPRRIIERVRESRSPAGQVVQDEHADLLQLQLVCYTLWEAHGCRGHPIQHQHLKEVSPRSVLENFYVEAVRAASGPRSSEAAIRHWFDRELITPGGRRNLVLADPATRSVGSLPAGVVQELAKAQIVRAEWRAGSQWYVLPHDRFIEPVRRSNASWFRPWPPSKKLAFAVLIAITMFGFFILGAARFGNDMLLALDRIDVVGQAIRPGERHVLEFAPGNAGVYAVTLYAEDADVDVGVFGAPLRHETADSRSFIGLLDLETEASQAQVVVSGRGSVDGRYWLSVAPSGHVLPGDGRVVAELSSAGEQDNHAFRLSAGEAVRIETSPVSGDLDTVLALLDPRGVQVALNDDADAEDFGSRIDHVARLSGAYRAVVESFRRASEGQYQLSVTAISPTDLAIDSETTLVFTERGGVEFLRVASPPEGLVVFEVTGDAPYTVRLFRGSGEVIARSGTPGDDVLITIRVPDPGEDVVLAVESDSPGVEATVRARSVE